MKKRTVCAAALAVAAAAVVIYHSGRISTGGKDLDILTPAMDSQEELLAEGTGDSEIFDGQVPLAPGPGTGEATENPYISQVVALVNEERAKAGLEPLEKSDELSAAAAIRVKEITSSFSHTRPDGSAYRTVLDQCGLAYSNCGENVAMGYRTPADVVAGWMASDGHRENILNEKYDCIGIGYCKDGGQGYWVQMFMLKKK